MRCCGSSLAQALSEPEEAVVAQKPRRLEAPKTKPPERGLVRLRSHRIGAGQGVSAEAAYPAPLVEMPLALAIGWLPRARRRQ